MKGCYAKIIITERERTDMGYYSTVTGTLTPKETIEVGKFDQFIKNSLEGKDFNFWISGKSSEYQEIDFYGNGKAYTFEAELKAFLKAATRAGLTYNGALERVGEEAPDFERFVIEDGKHTETYKGVITWVKQA